MKSLKFLISFFIIVMILIFIVSCSGTEPTASVRTNDISTAAETTVLETQQQETAEPTEGETIEDIKIEGKIIFTSDRDGD